MLGLDRQHCRIKNKIYMISSLMDLTLIKIIIDCESCYQTYKQGKVTESVTGGKSHSHVKRLAKADLSEEFRVDIKAEKWPAHEGNEGQLQ